MRFDCWRACCCDSDYSRYGGHSMSKTQTPPQKYAPDWLQTLDGRTALAALMRSRHTALCNDLGGADRLSYPQLTLIDRALFLQYWLEQEEQKLATGGDFDAGKWVQACNSLSGLFSKLGLERKAREVPALRDYLDNKRG